MKAFIKTLFGDIWNLAGVALIVVVGAAFTATGHGGWAVFAMPLVALAVVAALAGQ
jgi:hypothetical protein